MIQVLSSLTRPLLFQLRQTYHLLSMLESKYQAEQIKLNPMLFPLYMDRLGVGPFSERFLVVLAIDCYRTFQPADKLKTIVDYALKNLDRIQTRTTLVVLLNQMYFYKQNDKQIVNGLVQKALQIQQLQDSSNPYYNLKLLILISQLLGIDHYPEQFYRSIDFKRFKPLSIAMALQLFSDKKLQKKYSKLIEELVDMFVACESFVPFADVHHLSYAIRKIDHPKFTECFYRIRGRIQATLKKGKEEKEEEEGKWTTDEELITELRKNIENKYRLGE